MTVLTSLRGGAGAMLAALAFGAAAAEPAPLASTTLRASASSSSVSHDGVVYEKSFGAGTQAAVAAITRFNPDKSWAKVIAHVPAK